MTRNNYNLIDHPQFQESIDAWFPARRRFGMYPSCTGAGFVTHGIGNAFASGGAVTQATDKATGVTLNTLTGLITMNNAALVAGVEVSFTVTNSAVAAADTVVVNHASAGTAGAYIVSVSTVAAGSFAVTVENASAGNLSEAIVIGFSVVKAPFFKGTLVVGTGTAATNGDAVGGSFVTTITSANDADANAIVTATTVTRRSWNPWIRFSFVAGTSTQMASIRQWVGAYASDPSALDTLSTISAACFGWDTVVDGTSVASGTAFWKCNSSDAVTQKSTTTDMPIIAGGSYTGEIRMDTTNGRVDFYMAYHGVSTVAKVQSPLRLVASHATGIPVAATQLFVGGTVKVLVTAPAAKRLILGPVECSMD